VGPSPLEISSHNRGRPRRGSFILENIEICRRGYNFSPKSLPDSLMALAFAIIIHPIRSAVPFWSCVSGAQRSNAIPRVLSHAFVCFGSSHCQTS
jgi:hypothetical protein